METRRNENSGAGGAVPGRTVFEAASTSGQREFSTGRSDPAPTRRAPNPRRAPAYRFILSMLRRRD